VGADWRSSSRSPPRPYARPIDVIMTVQAPSRDEAVALAAHRARRSGYTPCSVKTAQQLGATWRVILVVVSPDG
jgi:hypothetical protein